jgi:hypothetical protein
LTFNLVGVFGYHDHLNSNITGTITVQETPTATPTTTPTQIPSPTQIPTPAPTAFQSASPTTTPLPTLTPVPTQREIGGFPTPTSFTYFYPTATNTPYPTEATELTADEYKTPTPYVYQTTKDIPTPEAETGFLGLTDFRKRFLALLITAIVITLILILIMYKKWKGTKIISRINTLNNNGQNNISGKIKEKNP